MSVDFSKHEIEQFLITLSNDMTPYEIRVDGEFSFIQDEFIHKVINWLDIPFYFYCLEEKEDKTPHAHFYIPLRDAGIKMAKSIRAKITNTFPQLKGKTQYKVGAEKEVGKLLPYILKGDRYYYVEKHQGATEQMMAIIGNCMNIDELMKNIKAHYWVADIEDGIAEAMPKKSNKVKAFQVELLEAFNKDKAEIMERVNKDFKKYRIIDAIIDWVVVYVEKWNYCEPSQLKKMVMYLYKQVCPKEYAERMTYQIKRQLMKDNIFPDGYFE